jgi:hypothetical protein
VKKENGYLSVGVHALTKSSPNDKRSADRTETGQIFVSDGIDSIIFHLGNDNQIVFDNDNIRIIKYYFMMSPQSSIRSLSAIPFVRAYIQRYGSG